MDLQLVAQLINMVTSSSLSSLEIEEAGMRIKLDNGGAAASMSRPAPIPAAAPVVTVPVEVNTAQVSVAVEPAAEKAEVGDEIFEVKAPMVGIFYTLGSMNRTDLKAGDSVSKGSVVCAIEAMKLINEVECEEDGEFVELLAQDGDQVEFGQPLMRIRRR